MKEPERILEMLKTQPVAVVPAEGARVGVVSCPICGAALLLDARDVQHTLLTHALWHARTEE